MGFGKEECASIFSMCPWMVWLVALSSRAGDRECKGATVMLDIIFIALVIVFFGIAFWYVRFCERV